VSVETQPENTEREATPEEIAEVEARYGQTITELVAEAERGYPFLTIGEG